MYAYLGTQGVRVMNTPHPPQPQDLIVVTYELYVVQHTQPLALKIRGVRAQL